MKSFQKRGKLKYIVQSKFFLIFLGIIIFVFIFNMFSFIGKMLETKENREIVEDRIEKLEESKEKFSTEIEKLKTENGIEENIREKFGLVKEGENMIMVVEDKNNETENKKTESKSFLNYLKDWFQ